MIIHKQFWIEENKLEIIKDKISLENKWGGSPIKDSYFRIMGILVDLRELCERSVEYNDKYKSTNIT